MIAIPRLNYREIYVDLVDLGFADRRLLDITDAHIIFTVKENYTDDDALAKIRKDNLGGGLEILDDKGQIRLTLTPGDMSLPPSDYRYDIFVIRDNKVYSSETGTFRVLPTVLGVLP